MKTSMSRSYAKRRMRAGRRLATLSAASLIAVMLALALLPLTTSGVSAADDEKLRISDSILVEPVLIDDIVLDPTPTPDAVLDDLVVEVDPGLIDDVVVDPVVPGTVHVAKFGCDDDYQGDYYQLAQNCGLMDAPFAVYYSGGEQFFDGGFIAQNIVPGDVTVAETIPGGFGEPYVFCSSLFADGSESGYAPTQTAQGAFSTVIDPGEYLYCDWFNVPADDNGTITINKWECPEDLAFLVEPTWEDYLAACTTAMNGVVFDLDYADEALTDRSGQTGDDGDGTLVFSDVEPGGLEIREQIPVGYGDPVVFCGFGAIYDEDGDGIATAIDGFIPGAALPGGVLQRDFLPAESLYCDWFNFPDDDDIVIYKWYCQEGYDAYNASLEELLQYCSQVMPGVGFSLWGDGENFIGDAVTDDSGFAGFGGVAAGSYALNEEVPDGFGEPIVYCERPDLDFEYWKLAGSAAIRFDLSEDGRITCYWFNIPKHDGSIVVHKYTCPPGYDLEAYGADPKADCWEKTNGIPFSLYGYGYSDELTVTGADIPGAVVWGGLEAGGYTVVEEVPSGTVATFVICQWEEELGPFKYETLIPYTTGDYWVGNRIDLELYQDTNIVCHWYNIPEDHEGGDLVVIKYWCDGAIYDEAHCELYGGGASFSVEAASGYGDPIFFTTGWDGTAQLYLEPGPYTLIETDRAWCKATSDQVDADGNVVVYDDQTSYVTVFNCGPGKKDDTPVKKFPNTGAGELVDEGGPSGSGTMGLLLSMGIIAALVAARGGRPRPAPALVRQDRDR